MPWPFGPPGNQVICVSLSAILHKDLGFPKSVARRLVKGPALPGGRFYLLRSLSCLVASDGTMAYLGVGTLVRT